MRKTIAALAVVALVIGVIGAATVQAGHDPPGEFTWSSPETFCVEDETLVIYAGTNPPSPAETELRDAVSEFAHESQPPFTRVPLPGVLHAECPFSLVESLPDGAAGEAYGATLLVDAGDAPFTWDVSGLPSGLELDEGTGELSGTPSSQGMFTIEVSVTNSMTSDPAVDGPRTLTGTYTIEIVGPGGAPPPSDDGVEDDGVVEEDDDCVPGVLTPEPGPGISMASWSCGGVEDLPDAIAYFVTHNGVFISYTVGAADFANQGFLQLFGDGIPAGTLLIVVR